MGTNYKTTIVFLPAPSKKITYGELKNSVRNLLGSVYENKKADSSTTTNCMVYDRQLSDKEKKAVDSVCNSNGIVVLFIEGTKSAFDNITNSAVVTVVLKEHEENKVWCSY